MAKILQPIDFSRPVNLDIGSGYAPAPDCYHLDIREDLPDIDIVCDFANENLPLPDQSVSVIISNHSLEHVRWPRLGFVAREWARVLHPGGVAQIRTPDLEFIMNKFLKRETTPEWPDDEKRAAEIFGSVSSSVWANIKLFAGQDYDSNVHYVCFDFEMLSSLLVRAGFSDVQRVKLDVEFSPGELQVRAIK